MSETAVGSGTSTVDANANGAVATQPESSQFVVDGKPVTPEYVRRLQQQVAGANKFAPVLKVMNEKGLDPAVVAATLAGSIGADPGDETPSNQPVDYKKLAREAALEIVNEREAVQTVARTEQDHNRTCAAHMAAITEQIKTELRGLDQEAIDIAIRDARDAYESAMVGTEYPAGHALHGKFYAPLDQSKLGTIAKASVGKINKIRGGALAALGRQAAAVSTPAGAPGGTGTTMTKGPRTNADVAAGIAQQAAQIAARKRGSGL